MLIDIIKRTEKEQGICSTTNEICRYTGQRGGNWCEGCEIAEGADDEQTAEKETV